MPEKNISIFTSFLMFHKFYNVACLIPCTLLGYQADCIGQRPYQTIIDSLQNALKTASLSVKSKIYTDLCYYTSFSSIDTALIYGKKALIIAHETGNDTSLAHAYRDIAGAYFVSAQYDSALSYYNSAIRYFEQLHDSAGIAKVEGNIGSVYQVIGDYDMALEKYMAVLPFFERNHNIEIVSKLMNNIASLYEYTGNIEDAIDWYKQSYTMKIPVGDSVDMGGSLNNIGSCFLALNSLDSGIYYCTGALELLEPYHDIRYLPSCYNNLGSCYFHKMQYDKSLAYYDKALYLRMKSKNLKGMASVHVNVAQVYLATGLLDSSELRLQKAEALARQIDAKPELKTIYNTWCKLYEKKGDFKNAYACHQKYFSISDSLINQDKEAIIHKLKIRYEAGKKDQQIKLQNLSLASQELRLEKQKMLLWLLVACLLSIVVTVIAVYRSQLAKRKIQQNQALLKQRKVEIKASIKGEEKERLRLATELHDGLGQVLSALKLNISALNNMKETDGLLKITDQAITDLRRISHNLMPGALLRHGLIPVLKDMVMTINKSRNLRLQLFVEDIGNSLGEELDIALYRIIQELINNALKYAKADNITVQLLKNNGRIILTVEDDGIGFNPQKKSDGLGLVSLSLRVNVLNGTFDLDTNKGHGTTVIIAIPIPKKSEKERYLYNIHCR